MTLPRPCRVLVVDDNVETARTFYLELCGFGHQAEFAMNGYAALESARRFRPDVVVLDIGLPDFDGYELARILRRELENTRILAVTGRGGKGERERALGAGCDDYLLKPIDPAALERSVQAMAPAR